MPAYGTNQPKAQIEKGQIHFQLQDKRNTSSGAKRAKTVVAMRMMNF